MIMNIITNSTIDCAAFIFRLGFNNISAILMLLPAKAYKGS